MYNDHVISQKEHDAWFSRALADTSAAYLVFLYEARPVGFASFTNISAVHGRCYWAFYLGELDVPVDVVPSWSSFHSTTHSLR